MDYTEMIKELVRDNKVRELNSLAWRNRSLCDAGLAIFRSAVLSEDMHTVKMLFRIGHKRNGHKEIDFTELEIDDIAQHCVDNDFADLYRLCSTN